MMKTKGWRVRVWQNDGWRYSICGPWMSVHRTSDGKFFAFVNDTGEADECDMPETYGRADRSNRSFVDPNDAVLARLADAVAHRDQLIRCLIKAHESLGLKCPKVIIGMPSLGLIELKDKK